MQINTERITPLAAFDFAATASSSIMTSSTSVSTPTRKSMTSHLNYDVMCSLIKQTSQIFRSFLTSCAVVECMHDWFARNASIAFGRLSSHDPRSLFMNDIIKANCHNSYVIKHIDAWVPEQRSRELHPPLLHGRHADRGVNRPLPLGFKPQPKPPEMDLTVCDGRKFVDAVHGHDVGNWKGVLQKYVQLVKRNSKAKWFWPFGLAFNTTLCMNMLCIPYFSCKHMFKSKNWLCQYSKVILSKPINFLHLIILTWQSCKESQGNLFWQWQKTLPHLLNQLR